MNLSGPEDHELRGGRDAASLAHLGVPVTHNVSGQLKGMLLGWVLGLKDECSGRHAAGEPAEKKVVGC